MSTGLGIEGGPPVAENALGAFAWRQARAGFLWLPVLLISGIFTFYSFNAPPPILPVAALSIAALPLLLLRHAGLRFILIGCFAFSAGFVLAGLELSRLAGGQLEAETVARMTGAIEMIEKRENDYRLLVRVRSFESSDGVAGVPRFVRITAREIETQFLPGDGVWLRGRLFPPPEAVSPFGYQFARWAFFREIGAVGYAYGTVREEKSADGGALMTALNRLRERIAQRIEAQLQGDAAALTVALSTGLRDRLSDRLEENLRAAGLAHILAISGLHMALLAGGIFWLVRLLIALMPGVGQGLPAKKIAAVVGLAAALFYLGLSGGAVSTQRAFVMVSIAFVAMLCDRPAISMRNLALAALIVAGLNPSAVTEPGFQMSFAATAGLIAVYAVTPAHWKRRPAEMVKIGGSFGAPLLAAFLRMLAFTFLTTFIAAIATAPFSSFHFERVAAYGLVGNMAVMPLFSFAVMPLIVFSLVLMPLGLEALPLTLLSLALEPLFAATEMVAGWPGAMIDVGRQSAAVTGLLSFSGLWLMLVRGRVRLLGLTGLILLPFLRAEGYDLYASADGKSVVARMADGSFARASSRGSDFAYDVWLSHEGRLADLESRAFASARQCSEEVCLLDSALGPIAVAESENAACASASALAARIVIIQEGERGTPLEKLSCQLSPLTFVQDARIGGTAFALREKPNDKPQIVTARQTLGQWPWVR